MLWGKLYLPSSTYISLQMPNFGGEILIDRWGILCPSHPESMATLLMAFDGIGKGIIGSVTEGKFRSMEDWQQVNSLLL